MSVNTSLLAIIFDETKKLTSKDCNSIKDVVDHQILKSDKVLTFESAELTNGYILVKCSNESSLKWLLDISEAYSHKRLPPTNVKIKRPQYFPVFTLLTFKAGTCTCIFEMLKKQNSHLDTKEWLILSKKEFHKADSAGANCLYLIRVDPPSIKFLHRHSWELYCGLSKIKFEKFDDRLYKDSQSDIPESEAKMMFNREDLEQVPLLRFYNWDMDKYVTDHHYENVHYTEDNTIFDIHMSHLF